jgi:hypothetical protein
VTDFVDLPCRRQGRDKDKTPSSDPRKTAGFRPWVLLGDVPSSVEIEGGGSFTPDRKIGVLVEGDRRWERVSGRGRRAKGSMRRGSSGCCRPRRCSASCVSW